MENGKGTIPFASVGGPGSAPEAGGPNDIRGKTPDEIEDEDKPLKFPVNPDIPATAGGDPAQWRQEYDLIGAIVGASLSGGYVQGYPGEWADIWENTDGTRREAPLRPDFARYYENSAFGRVALDIIMKGELDLLDQLVELKAAACKKAGVLYAVLPVDPDRPLTGKDILAIVEAARDSSRSHLKAPGKG